MNTTLDTPVAHDTRPSQMFLRAGNATFTVANPKGDHYTFCIQTPDVDEDTPVAMQKPIWFVSLLSGPDNHSDYVYLGVYDPGTAKLRLTKKSKYNDDSLPVKVFRWAVALIYHDQPTPAGYSIARSCRCGRCGRTLTHPDGVTDEGYRQGFGPVCWAKLQGE